MLCPQVVPSSLALSYPQSYLVVQTETETLLFGHGHPHGKLSRFEPQSLRS